MYRFPSLKHSNWLFFHEQYDGVTGKMFWWLTKKIIFLTVSWLSGLLSAEIFISTGEWGVQMPPLTSENSYFLRSGPQGATLVMFNPNSNSNSNSGKSLEYQLQLQLQEFQLQLQLQLRQVSWISTPTPEVSTPIPTPELELNPTPTPELTPTLAGDKQWNSSGLPNPRIFLQN